MILEPTRNNDWCCCWQYEIPSRMSETFWSISRASYARFQFSSHYTSLHRFTPTWSFTKLSPEEHCSNNALTAFTTSAAENSVRMSTCYMHTSPTITTCEGVVVQVRKIELFHHSHQTTGKFRTNFQRQVRISASYTQTTTYGSRLSFRETPTRVRSSFTRSRSTCQRQISVTRHLT